MQQISVHEGLSDALVTSVAKTDDHSLWIGTNDGLNRFDGFRIKEYNTLNSNLPGNIIRELLVLGDGRLLVVIRQSFIQSYARGLYFYDPASDDFTSLEDQYGQIPFPNIDYGAVYLRDSLLLFSLREKGAWTLNWSKGVWTKVENDSTGNISFLVDNQLIRIRDAEVTVLRLTNPDFVTDVSGEVARAPFNTIMKTEMYGPDWSRSLPQGGGDNLSISTWAFEQNRLFGFHPDGKRMQFTAGRDFITLPAVIEEVWTDPEGLLYVATLDGLFLVKLEPARFDLYMRISDSESFQSGVSPSCRGLVVIDDTLYINRADAIYAVRVDDGSIIHTIDEERMFPSRNIGDGRFLTGRPQLIRYDCITRRREILIDQDQLIVGPLWSVLPHMGAYYLGGSSGTMIVDSTADTDGRRNTICISEDLNGTYIYYIAPMENGGMIYASSAGLFIGSELSCERIPVRFHYPDGRAGLFSHFTHVLPNDDGTYWISSLDGGIVKAGIQDTTGVIQFQLNRENGLPTNTTYAMFRDRRGNIWASTDRGLVHLNTDDWSYRVYTTEDGLPENEFNRLSFYQDPRGRMYFGGLNGVIGFNPEDFYSDDERKPELSILSVRQFSGWEDTIVNRTQQTITTSRIRFNPADKFFEVSVGLDDMFQTSEHQYQYRFQGIDSTWESMQGNAVRFNSLPFGQHSLEIRAKDAFGDYAGNTLSIAVDVLRPFYLRWWFFLLVAFGVFITIREWLVSRTRRINKLERVVAERTEQIARQNQALLELQETRSRFFANISHELRTPLTLIKGPVESLLRQDLPEESKSYLKLVKYNAQLLHERIDDLLSLSQADANRLSVQKAPMNLNMFLERLTDMFAGGAQEKGIRISLKNHLPASASIEADRKKLQHILSNYLSNAIKFSAANSVIDFECAEENGVLKFSVRDEGPGISTEDHELVFERFFQSGDGAVQSGAGLGLALSREFANVMSGSVWVESELGKGSTFFLTLPYCPVTMATADEHNYFGAAPISPAPGTMRIEQDAHAATILVVEDHRAMREFLVHELGQYHVVTAENGKVAVDLLQRMKKNASLPDLVVSDVMMPEMDGFELLQFIKGQSAYAAIPVVMLTARAGMEDKLKALRIGVHDYITKPFGPEELRIRINNLLQRKPDKQVSPGDAAEERAIDHAWLRDVEDQIWKHLGDRNFSVARLADDLHISESQLLRRLKAYTGLTPSRYLREARLYRAKELLESGELVTVASLSAAVGFEDPDYFSRIFAERFGYRPSERV